MERVFSVSDGVVTFKSCSMASIDGVRVKGKAYASVGYFSLSFFLSSFIFIFLFFFSVYVSTINKQSADESGDRGSAREI